MSRPLQALIFDMDGVICDTMPYHLEAWRQYIQTIPDLAGISRDRLQQLGGKRNHELLSDLLAAPVDEADLFCWGMEKEALYRDLIRDNIQFLPGLLPFLKQAQSQGLQLGLGTSACEENVELLLGHKNLDRFFAAQVTELDVELGKPDPECYLLVADQLGVAPAHCLVFEDAVAGVQSARNAGMRCWGVTTTQSPEVLLAAGAECCIQDFRDRRLQALLANDWAADDWA
ncbi:HAD family hydrolase [Lyngbya confervoides]|uniref:HAD family phosphatase n=1 Tax=Lyngbya confervoides BDU141951 TaxID=1574623 RepID=A0ABD4T082_9CYAN|nr:HAD family phosphatase [Lyngbya confervoides]MCM1982025.1 HAD family phosphatase [Lyngbya confervoides BDU141951]